MYLTYHALERFLDGVDVDNDELDVMVQVEALLHVLIVCQHGVADSTQHPHVNSTRSLHNIRITFSSSSSIIIIIITAVKPD